MKVPNVITRTLRILPGLGLALAALAFALVQPAAHAAESCQQSPPKGERCRKRPQERKYQALTAAKYCGLEIKYRSILGGESNPAKASCPSMEGPQTLAILLRTFRFGDICLAGRGCQPG
jgi:hypothetical protein